MADIRLAKGEDVDEIRSELARKVNITDMETDGYLKKKLVGALPSVSVEFDFSDGISRFNPANRCSAAIETTNGNSYQKITTASNAANTYAFAYFDFGKHTKGADSVIIEFDTKINGDRWYIGLSDLTQRPAESYRSTYDHTGVVFSQGTKDGSYLYVNGNITWKDAFFGVWVHSRIVIDFTSKTVSYTITNGNSADTISGTAEFCDESTTQITGLEAYSYVNGAELCVDNIQITAKFGEECDERTMYIIAEDGAFAEYIYIDGKPVCIGRSDICETVNSLLERVAALEGGR